MRACFPLKLHETNPLHHLALGGRTYPLEGSMVLLPQHAPYTDPLKVLLCGGSTGPGPASPLDNCVSIEPESENANWTIERMVRAYAYDDTKLI